MRVRICIVVFHFFFSMIRPPPRSTLFPTRRSSDLAGKRRLFAAMQEEYRSLKASWGGFAGYDRLFERGANNALLASVASYSELVPAFRGMLAQKDGDLPGFYAAVRELANLDKPERDARP